MENRICKLAERKNLEFKMKLCGGGGVLQFMNIFLFSVIIFVQNREVVLDGWFQCMPGHNIIIQ